MQTARERKAKVLCTKITQGINIAYIQAPYIGVCVGRPVCRGFFLLLGREGVSPKGDSGRCLAVDHDSLFFVERMWDMTASSQGRISWMPAVKWS